MNKKYSILKNHPKLYGVWANMKERCDNENYASYKYYGGRGIKYEPSWADVHNFFKDMFPTYKPGLTLDRIDNNRGYSKNNCQWVTMKRQSNNKRSNNYITYNGKTQSIADWADELELNHNTLWHRIMVYKWPLKQSLTREHYVSNQFIETRVA